jgi:hypothetical protein
MTHMLNSHPFRHVHLMLYASCPTPFLTRLSNFFHSHPLRVKLNTILRSSPAQRITLHFLFHYPSYPRSTSSVIFFNDDPTSKIPSNSRNTDHSPNNQPLTIDPRVQAHETIQLQPFRLCNSPTRISFLQDIRRTLMICTERLHRLISC